MVCLIASLDKIAAAKKRMIKADERMSSARTVYVRERDEYERLLKQHANEWLTED